MQSISSSCLWLSLIPVSIRTQRLFTPFFSSDPPPVRAPSLLIRAPLLTTSSSLLCRASEGSSAQQPLDLTEENVERVLLDARSELLQIFDLSVGITGVAELAEMDGPFLKLRLKGRFWHERSLVLARLGNYLQKRIPEIVEVGIEDDSQLDDSSSNFGHD